MKLRRLVPDIPVADIARSVAFYRDHLGFEVIHEDDGYAMLERDHQRIDFSRRDGGGVRLWLVVSDIRALHDKLVASGLEVSRLSPRHYWVWEFELMDPDGALLMCVQPPPAPGLEIPELFEAIADGDDDTVADALARDKMAALETTGWYWGWDRDDWSTIQVVAGAGTPYILELVLEAGADPTGGEPLDDNWWAPVDFAAARNPQLVPRLVEAGAKPGACCAAAMGWLDQLRALPPGAESEAGSGGATPLHYAVGGGQVEAVELLLARGANPSVRCGFYGMTPRAWASWAGDKQAAVEALLPAS